MFCQYCGERVADNAAFCSHCGRSLGSLTVRENQQIVTPQGFKRVRTSSGMVVDVPIYEDPSYGQYGGSYQGGYYPQPQRPRSNEERLRESGFLDDREARIDAEHRLPNERVGDERNGKESVQRWSANDGIKHRNAGKVRPTKDKNFTKFLEEPLPMRPVKIIIGIILCMLSVFAVFNAIKGGALEIVRDPSRTGMEIAGFVLAATWLVVALIGFIAKYHKGATIMGGVLLLFATGIAFTTKESVPYGMYYALFSFLSSVIFLISGSGGVNLNDIE